MKLKFNVEYFSITRFRDADLPPFTVLTGLNGSGKTQLTHALKAGNVAVEGISVEEIVRFDISNFVLDNEESVNFKYLWDQRQAVLTAIEELNRTNALGFELELQNKIQTLATAKNTPYYCLTNDEFKNEGLESGFSAYYSHCYSLWHIIKNRRTGVDPQLTTPALLRLFDISPKPLSQLTLNDLNQLYLPLALKNDFLLQRLGSLFSDYWQKSEQNAYNRYRNQTFGDNLPVLSPESFTQRYGDKPWELVNRFLAEFSGLAYRVNNPEGLNRDDNFHLRLISQYNPDVNIDFIQLSSGERTMMALASCLLKASIDNIFPKLLILDEIDSSLHPSMIRNMINTLYTVLVCEKGLNVLLVTHSPTTVALAPPDSLVLMNRSGENRLGPISNKNALHLLTEGFASLTLAESHLSIDYKISQSPNNVVFTEGITDRIILEMAWETLEPSYPRFFIQDCFDASFLRNLFKREELFKNYPGKHFVAIFDFDAEGFNAWNQLSEFEIVEEDPRKGLLKKHRRYQAYAMLLPVPLGLEAQVIKSGNNTFAEKAYLPIELLFYGTSEANPHYILETQPGGGSLVKFIGDKTKFAQEASKSFPPNAFVGFRPIIDSIKSIFPV